MRTGAFGLGERDAALRVLLTGQMDARAPVRESSGDELDEPTPCSRDDATCLGAQVLAKCDSICYGPFPIPE